jgi:hypothetical protein
MLRTVAFMIVALLSVYGLAALIWQFVANFISPCHPGTVLLLRPEGEAAELQLRGALRVAEEQGLTVLVLCDRADAEVRHVCGNFAVGNGSIILCEDMNAVLSAMEK